MAKEEVEETKPPKKKPWLLIVIISFLVLSLIGGVVMSMMFLNNSATKSSTEQSGETETAVAQDEDKTDEKAKPAIYIPLDPPFVVNFEGGSSRVRFLQVTVEVMTRHPEVKELVEKHSPVIRNNLVLLFSSQTYEGVSTLAGKGRLREEALHAVQKILEDETGDPGVEALYFTSFVMQ